MGCPSPAILFLRYIEETYIVQIARNHHLLGYFRYVDDILIIYYHNITGMNLFLQDCNLIRNEVIKQEMLYIQNNVYNIYFRIQLINKFLDKHNKSNNTIDDNKDIQSQEKWLLPLPLVTKHMYY